MPFPETLADREEYSIQATSDYNFEWEGLKKGTYFDVNETT